MYIHICIYIYITVISSSSSVDIRYERHPFFVSAFMMQQMLTTELLKSASSSASLWCDCLVELCADAYEEHKSIENG